MSRTCIGLMAYMRLMILYQFSQQKCKMRCSSICIKNQFKTYDFWQRSLTNFTKRSCPTFKQSSISILKSFTRLINDPNMYTSCCQAESLIWLHSEFFLKVLCLEKQTHFFEGIEQKKWLRQQIALWLELRQWSLCKFVSLFMRNFPLLKEI